MSDLIISEQHSNPFDSICHIDDQGNEYWLARELMWLLGYQRWERFADAIDRAKASCQNAGNPLREHFFAEVRKGNGRPFEDYQLTRYASYLIAQNGDPRKTEIAAAQSYFAIKTREAEVIVPAQSDRIRELELEVLLRREDNRGKELDANLIALHGPQIALAMRGKEILMVEVPITEVVEQATGNTTRFLTADQLKREVKNRAGQILPSLKWFAQQLRDAGRDDLLVPVTRNTTSEYPIPEKLDEAIAIVYGQNKQRLIGT